MGKKLAQAVKELTLGEKIVLAAALAAGAGAGGYGGSEAGRRWAERNPLPRPAEIVEHEREAQMLDAEMERLGAITYEIGKDGSVIRKERPDRITPELSRKLDKLLLDCQRIDPMYPIFERAVISRNKRAKRTGAGLGVLGGGLLGIGGVRITKSTAARWRSMQQAREEAEKERKRQRERDDQRERLGLRRKDQPRRRRVRGYGGEIKRDGGSKKRRPGL